MNTHLSRAAEILGRLMLDPESIFAAKPAQGTLRGIDVYPAGPLVRVIAACLDKYEHATGEPMPDPEKATLLREKIFWSNFFRPMTIPTPADKLAVYSMLPMDAKLRVKEPPKVWQSERASLPDNNIIRAGSYYLKPNHASKAYQRVVYPLEGNQRVALEAKAKKWLHSIWGWKGGEWWYSMIKPRLFLEKELDLAEDHPGEFKLHTVNGRVTHFHVNRVTPEGPSTSIYDRDLNLLDLRYKGRPNIRQKLRSKVADVIAIA